MRFLMFLLGENYSAGLSACHWTEGPSNVSDFKEVQGALMPSVFGSLKYELLFFLLIFITVKHGEI